LWLMVCPTCGIVSMVFEGASTMVVSNEAMMGEVCKARLRQVPVVHSLRASIRWVRATHKLRKMGAKSARFGRLCGRTLKVHMLRQRLQGESMVELAHRKLSWSRFQNFGRGLSLKASALASFPAVRRDRPNSTADRQVAQSQCYRAADTMRMDLRRSIS
jgi:hypothetical protein